MTKPESRIGNGMHRRQPALKHYPESAAAIYAILSAGPGWGWTRMIGGDAKHSGLDFKEGQ